MGRKGFPESFDAERLLQFFGDMKSGVARVTAPVYSHVQYDILAGQNVTIEQPDILIIEGLNILQAAEMPAGGGAIPFVSDFIDFSIYIDAAPEIIEHWYLDAVYAAALNGIPRSGRLLPQIRDCQRRRSAPDGVDAVAHGQLEESRRKHSADAAAGAADICKKPRTISVQSVALRKLVSLLFLALPAGSDAKRTEAPCKRAKKKAAWGSGPGS